jgi:hypothetical protein
MKYKVVGECWEFIGSRTNDGYGHVGARTHHGQTLAHRYAWIRAYGPIPEGMQVLHRCDNPACIRLEHLFLGTHADNMEDMTRKDRHGRSKLSVEEVRHIKALLEEGRTLRSLSVQFDIGYNTLWNIKHGRSWKWIRIP